VQQVQELLVEKLSPYISDPQVTVLIGDRDHRDQIPAHPPLWGASYRSLASLSFRGQLPPCSRSSGGRSRTSRSNLSRSSAFNINLSLACLILCGSACSAVRLSSQISSVLTLRLRIVPITHLVFPFVSECGQALASCPRVREVVRCLCARSSECNQCCRSIGRRPLSTVVQQGLLPMRDPRLE